MPGGRRTPALEIGQDARLEVDGKEMGYLAAGEPAIPKTEDAIFGDTGLDGFLFAGGQESAGGEDCLGFGGCGCVWR